MVLISIKHIIGGLAALAIGAQCGVIDSGIIESRELLGADEVEPLKQAVRSGKGGQLLLKHKPYLKVRHGCVPHPAVDVDGNVNAGLKASGFHSGMCDSSTGQVYGRTVMYAGRRALMYAWYFPKDNPSPAVGHRHDWESIVVWLNKNTDKYIGMSASGHGSFKKNIGTPSRLYEGHPLIEYDNPISIDGVNHRLDFTTERGGMQPLVDWATLTGKVQKALQNTDWGDANCPIGGSRFWDELEKARLDS